MHLSEKGRANWDRCFATPPLETAEKSVPPVQVSHADLTFLLDCAQKWLRNGSGVGDREILARVSKALE